MGWWCNKCQKNHETTACDAHSQHHYILPGVKFDSAAEAELYEAKKLLKEIRGWDMLDVVADGPYWKEKIDKFLGHS